MNQSNVPLDEVSVRLSILCEYLLDNEKPIEEAYESLMAKLDRKLMECTEFEYWFKRFQNKQFDLGYDTSQDSKKVPEASGKKDASTVTMEMEVPVEVAERNMEDLKLDHQFKMENVPQDFQTLVNNLSKDFGIEVYFNEKGCTISVNINEIDWEKRGNDWMIKYADNDTVIKTDDPEKSIVDHLWFVLRNPSIKLEEFSIHDHRNPEFEQKNKTLRKLDFGKLNTLLQSMFDTFNHQIQTTILSCEGFNEDTFFSILKHVKPETLKDIIFDISWKEEGDHRRMKEIVETEQWKQAETIDSRGVTPLRIDDLFQYERFSLQLDRITSEDVLRVTQHYFNTVERKSCHLSSKNKSIDIEAIMDVLRSQNDGSKIRKIPSYPDRFDFQIFKSANCIALFGSKNWIHIQNSEKHSSYLFIF